MCNTHDIGGGGALQGFTENNINKKFDGSSFLKILCFFFFTLMSAGCHFPSYIPATEKKQHPVRECVVCKRRAQKENAASPEPKRKRAETVFWCASCGKALHPVPCFEIYHTKLDITSQTCFFLQIEHCKPVFEICFHFIINVMTRDDTY